MQDKDDLLNLVFDGCFGYADINSIYNLSFDELFIFFVLSFCISIALHKFYNNSYYKISKQNQIEIIKIREYSFVSKIVVVFLVLILTSMPIFKLLNLGYFL